MQANFEMHSVLKLRQTLSSRGLCVLFTLLALETANFAINTEQTP